MAVKINVEKKKKQEIQIGSIVFSTLNNDKFIRMVIKDSTYKYYKLLNLNDGRTYGQEDTIEALVKEYELKLATNDMTITLHDVENI